MKGSITQFVQQLIKSIMGQKLYQSQSDYIRQFIQKAHTALLKEQEERGSVILMIDEDRIVYNGDIIFEDSEKATSLPLFLYRNGIRSFTFLEDMPIKELIEFVDLIAEEEYSLSIGFIEDIWERQFEHILYDAIEQTGEDYSFVLQNQGELGSRSISLVPVATKVASSYISLIEKASPISSPKLEIDRKNSSILLLRSIQEILDFEQDMEKREGLLSQFYSIVENFIKMRKISELVESKELLTSLLEKEKSPRPRKVLYETFDLFSKDDAVTLYFDVLKSSESKGTKEHALTMIGFLGTEVIDRLINTLHFITDGEIRSEVISLLEGLLLANKDVLVSYLQSASARTFRVLLSIIKRSKDPYFIPHLKPYLSGERAEMVRQVLFPLISRSEVIKYLEHPHSSVRIAALEEMKEIWGEEEFNMIANRIKSRDFWNLSDEEKKLLLDMLATMNIPETIELFRKVLRKRHFFNKDVYRTKEFVVESLASIDSKEAVLLIVKLKKSRHLKDAAERVLRNYEG
ncbi:hypothetical protein KAW18_14630 [candidate division WOR-3 bacterium]|nr:hypothetical protein [candidate division WOR-3 bacterium]